jgi:hypothetical protein
MRRTALTFSSLLLIAAINLTPQPSHAQPPPGYNYIHGTIKDCNGTGISGALIYFSRTFNNDTLNTWANHLFTCIQSGSGGNYYLYWATESSETHWAIVVYPSGKDISNCGGDVAPMACCNSQYPLTTISYFNVATGADQETYTRDVNVNYEALYSPLTAISDLSLVDCTMNQIEVGWTAPAQAANAPAKDYEVRYSTSPITDANWGSATFCVYCGTAPTDPGSWQTEWVSSLSSCTFYYIGIKYRNCDNTYSPVSNNAYIRTKCTSNGICVDGNLAARPSDDEDRRVMRFGITAVSPNPARDQLSIAYAIAPGGAPTTDIGVFDLTGRRIATVFRGPAGPGKHTVEWGARSSSGERVHAGMYWLRLSSGNQTQTRPVLIR